MNLETLDARIAQMPRANIGFYPTPFHALRNLSRRYGVNLFLKREDLAGPGTISGSKTRLAEFILGRALQDGYTHVITQGAYLTNSGLQFAAACRVAGLQPILFLTRDLPRHGELDEYRGNLLLNQAMGVETHLLGTSGAHVWDTPEDGARMQAEIDARRAELEAQGYKVLIVPTGGAHPDGYVAHSLTFKEMLEQSDVELDFVYHTIGTGTALPGMLAAKLMTNHPVKFRSIAIVAYDDDGWIGPATIVERTKHALAALDAEIPADDVIRAEIDIDQGFIGEDYAVPTEQSTAAIRELAHQEGVFVGPVYTGKGFAGLLDHVRSGRIGSGSNVAFLHTGDTGNLFEIAAVVGEVAPPIPSAAAGR
jgi:1-aminocyclopropane-1-carboxylate deaminase/D-cysteine desulfhydrase-like pyridoxal-dependent ACC family enzyme